MRSLGEEEEEEEEEGEEEGHSPLCVVGVSLPIDHDTRFIANSPRVVPWCHNGKVTRAILHLFAVVCDDFHPARDKVPRVSRLTTFGLGDRLHVL